MKKEYKASEIDDGLIGARHIAGVLEKTLVLPIKDDWTIETKQFWIGHNTAIYQSLKSLKRMVRTYNKNRRAQ